jgi:hypothetical protein
MKRGLSLLLGLFALVLTACTQETPTDIGGPLLPGGDVRTFEIIFEPAQYLEYDTAFSGYANAFGSPVLAIARNFEGVVNANTLLRFARPATSIQVRNAAGTVVTDTLPRYTTGRLVIRIDTARSRGAATVSVYRAAENFDASTATWTVRSDTGGVRQTWRTPGGTLGQLIGSAQWTPGVDSLSIPLDSAKIAGFNVADDSLRGAIITIDQTTSPSGSRLRVVRGSTGIRLSATSSIRADTVVAVNVDPTVDVFIFTPEPPTNVASGPRVSGVPAWRTILTLREDLRNFTVPCPGRPGCTLRLGDLHVNIAELLLRPTASPPGYSPEDSIIVNARASVEGTNVPLSRSPVADIVGASRTATPAARFTANDTGPDVVVTVSPLLESMLVDSATVAADRAPRRIALLTSPEAASFGFASFRAGPRLRLVVTTSTEQR